MLAKYIIMFIIRTILQLRKQLLKTTLNGLFLACQLFINEISEIKLIGSRYPQFPPEANPTVTYAWDLDDQEDGDCYHEIITALDRINRKEV